MENNNFLDVVGSYLNLEEKTYSILVPIGWKDKLKPIINPIDSEKIVIEEVTHEELMLKMMAEEEIDLILTDSNNLLTLVERFPYYFYNLTNELNSEEYSNFTLENIRQLNGEICSLPFNNEPIVYYYNKNLNENLAIFDFENNQEITWDEFCDIGHNLFNNYGIYMLPYPSEKNTTTLLKSMGYNFYDDAKKIPSILGCQEVMVFVKELYKNDIMCYEEYDEEQLKEKFIEGKIFGMFGNSRDIKKLEKLDIPLGYIQLPKSEIFKYDVSLDGMSWLITDSNESSNLLSYLKEIFCGENILPLIEDEKIIPGDYTTSYLCETLPPEPNFDENIIYPMSRIGENFDTHLCNGSLSAFGSELLYENTLRFLDKDLDLGFVVEDIIKELNECEENHYKYNYRLVIDQLPNKLVYLENEYFDKKGLVVCVETYCVQTGVAVKKEVIGYKLNIKDRLTLNDKDITVVYEYLGKTLKTQFGITVKPNISQLKSKKRTEFGDSPKIDLYTGKASYISGDISIGTNRNSIYISHVYNEDIARYCPEIITGLGKGWKFNIQQFIKKIDNQLYYCDAEGYFHLFKNATIDNQDNTYYDADGEGLTLYENYTFGNNNNYWLLCDSDKSYMVFDEKGRVVRIISAPCRVENLADFEAIVLEYQNNKYNNDCRIKEVYFKNGTTKTNILKFDYEKTNYVKSIKTNLVEDGLNKQVMFFYNNYYQLICRAIGEIKENYFYTNKNKLSQIESVETGTVACIGYNGERVNSLSIGYKNKENIYIPKSKMTFNYVYRSNTNLVINTEVTNDNGVCVVYMFNEHGEIVSSFEKCDETTFYTLQNEPGNYITSYADNPHSNSLKINNKYTKGFSGCTSNVYVKTLRRSGEENVNMFSLNCYVKLISNSEKQRYASIKYCYNDQEYIETVKLDNSAVDVWQKVSIPFSIDKEKNTNAEIDKLRFFVHNEYGNSEYFSQSDMYVTPSNKTYVSLTGFTIDNTTPNQNPFFNILRIFGTLNQITSAKVTCNGIEKTINFSKNISVDKTPVDVQITDLTYYDLLETAKSLYKNRNNTGNATFCYNGGKNRIYNVDDVKLYRDKDYIELIDLTTGQCKFAFNHISSDNFTKTEVSTKFTDIGIETETKIEVEKNIDGKTEKKSSTCSQLISYDGRKLKETDAYNVKTIYEYDDYLNLKQVKLVGEDNKELIIDKREYDENGDYLNNISVGFSSSAYTYDKPFDSVIRETERSFDIKNQKYSKTSLNKNISYDAKGRVNSVGLVSGDEEILRNDITYEDGRIRTVSDGASKYGIKYDIENDSVTYTAFDGETEVDLQKHCQTKIENNQTETVETYFRDSTSQGENIDKITTISDKYGKALSLSDGENETTYQYKSVNGFDGASLIEKVLDPYEKTTYTYKYDHDGKMCGWEAVNKDDGKSVFAVHQLSNTETEYLFNNFDKYKTQLVYDKDVVNQPRLMGTRLYSSCENGSDGWSDRIYYTTYEYDSLARVVKKCLNYSNSNNKYEYIYLTDDRGNSMPNLQMLIYDFSNQFDKNNWTHTYEYDDKGNITSKELKKSTQTYTHTTQQTTIHTYKYDNANRLTGENIQRDNQTPHICRKYTYQKNGRLNSIESGDTKTFSYDSYGRLKTINQIENIYSYDYDNYGNVVCKKVNTNSLIYKCGWERGNLLNQVVKSDKTAKYEYNHQNVRFKKTVNGAETKYYLDGTKILGEDRYFQNHNIAKKIRYFYDADGLCGFYIYINDSIDMYYKYIKDEEDNIIGIIDSKGMLVAEYEYDYLGNTKVTNHNIYNGIDNIGDVNPFRWKSFYYDEETGFYYANGRYYEIDRCGYIDAMEADIVESNAYNLLGLDRNGTMVLTLFMLAPYSATIATALNLSPDPTYAPDSDKSWWSMYVVGFVLSTLQICMGIAQLFMGDIGGGIISIVSGGAGLIGVLISQQIAGAIGMATLGAHTIWIGMQVLSCNLAYGLTAMAVGASCIAFSTAEAQEALGYGNWMKDTGMSDGWYNGVMIATNVAAIAVNIVGVKQCFKEGTLVACLGVDGKEIRKPIEDIRVGNKVLAYNEETGEQEYKEVVRLFRNSTTEWYHVFVNGEEIICTGGHPFYVAELDKFIPARELEIGAKLLLSTGVCAIIKNIEIEDLEKPETTYNFEVEDFHTYYVTDSQVLVHNKCDPKWTKERRRYWKEQAEKYKGNANEQLSASGTYKVDGENIKRMLQGNAPMGTDGQSVNLHHTFGRSGENFYKYQEVTRSYHYENFSALHPWLFGC